MVTVAVIDEGISSNFFDLGKIAYSLEITPELIIKDVINKNINHGTICAAIIKKYYPDVILISIKILDEKSHKCKKEQLIMAIEWCIYNNVKIVNLSIGTIVYLDFEDIREIIDKAYREGIIIVAACNNKDIFTFPASYRNVIGVKCYKGGSLREGEYIYNLYPLDGIEITSCSEHELLLNDLESITSNKCNSYATPMITAEVCKIINRFPNISLDKIKEELYKYSINYSNNKLEINNYKNIDWIGDAALVNINEDILQLSNTDKIKTFIKFDDINVDKFDTLIILSSTIEDYKRIRTLVHQFQIRRKNVIVINDKYKNYEFISKNHYIKFWNPLIVNNFYEEFLPKRKVDVPLIIVYDYTDSKLNELLNKLTKKFINDGYYAFGASINPICVLHMLEYIPVNEEENFSEIKDKIEALYRVYDFDVIFLGLSVNRKDVDKIKDANRSLNPDKTIFLVDNFTYKVKKHIEDVCIDLPVVITTQKSVNKDSCSSCKVFGYEELDLCYKYILKLFV